ncbi:thioredoxin family protein [Pseudomonas sp.]|uniref:thioredoxin family protein n=1 Tax=Pseudomonas sp. TaxID=306 RepID=UPI003F3A8488
MSNLIRSFNDYNFEHEVMRTSATILVHFSAEWASQSKALNHILADISTIYSGRAIIGNVDTNEQPDLATRFQIRSIPSILLFKDGAIVERVVGTLEKNAIEEMLDKAIR